MQDETFRLAALYCRVTTNGTHKTKGKIVSKNMERNRGEAQICTLAVKVAKKERENSPSLHALGRQQKREVAPTQDRTMDLSLTRRTLCH